MGKLGKQYKQGSNISQVLLGIVLFVSILIVGLVLWWFRVNTQTEVNIPAPVIDDTSQKPEQKIEQQNSSKEPVAPKELFDSKMLQETLDKWGSSIPGAASVVLMDTDGNILASLKEDQKYFTASIYKLFVAYAGYLQLDAGLFDPNEAYINGHTRLECLDLMIRESDGPCAEKLWNEIGKTELTKQLTGYGIENTSMAALNTTANDVAIMLVRIANGESLSTQSQDALLTSMENQIFRNSLNKGFSDQVTIYNKVGFNEFKEYHDVAIVEYKDGRKLIVSVLTEGVGTTNIAKLGKELEQVTR